ncbi:MAG: ParB/RepB/Spo0J family partition protein [Syntrophomonadaceae bacterium]
MAKKERGLGRGLEALFSVNAENDNIEEINEVKIESIIPREGQPRRNFDQESLQGLAESIKEHGVLQPVLVREHGEYYEIIAGERRWRAAIKAGLKTVPVVIRKFNDLQAAEIALIENLQREDLTVVEEAQAYQQMIDSYQYTQEKLALKIGKSRAHIANTLRILNLPSQIITMLDKRQITAGHARAILAYKEESEQLAIAEEIVSAGLSVREAEKKVRFKKNGQKKPLSKAPEIVDLEERMEKFFGTKTNIIMAKKGGKIEITFYNEDDLQRIIETLDI